MCGIGEPKLQTLVCSWLHESEAIATLGYGVIGNTSDFGSGIPCRFES